MYTLGLDIGSTTAKGVLLDADKSICGKIIQKTSTDPAGDAQNIYSELTRDIDSEICVVATGYGRALVKNADRAVTEITCHARGASQTFKDNFTLIDIGGQDSKVIRVSSGQVEDFAMNDRCAAGTGAFLDVIAKKFSLAVTELSNIAASDQKIPEISSTCVVFAESEVVGLLAKGFKPEAVLVGVHRAIAARTMSLISQVKGTAPFCFSGGVALNVTMKKSLEEQLGAEFISLDNPQFVGAYGAALLAGDS